METLNRNRVLRPFTDNDSVSLHSEYSDGITALQSLSSIVLTLPRRPRTPLGYGSISSASNYNSLSSMTSTYSCQSANKCKYHKRELTLTHEQKIKVSHIFRFA